MNEKLAELFEKNRKEKTIGEEIGKRLDRFVVSLAEKVSSSSGEEREKWMLLLVDFLEKLHKCHSRSHAVLTTLLDQVEMSVKEKP